MEIVIAIVAVLVVLAIIAFVVLPRTRARAQERKLEHRRGEMADRHRTEAEERKLKADYAEQQAQRERAEADLHEARAKLHERGMADEDLDPGAERFARDRDPATQPPER
jgi:flagellar biosynthesis/type III secretory pathway M-ring protein FliF/YscJ